MRRAVIASLLLIGGCSSAEPTPSPAPTPEPEPATTSTSGPVPTTAREPAAAPLPLPEGRTVTFTTDDGVTIAGTLRDGASPSAPLVILVHQLSTTRAEWAPLLRRLAAPPALTTFALDMRGHGESTSGPRGPLSWSDFETTDWERVADDVLAALRYLTEELGLTPERVVLVGSSIGSTAVIRAAAREPRVEAVVALSPGRAYRGVDAMAPLAALRDRRLLAVASRGEPASAEVAEQMGAIVPAGEHLLVDGDRHGVRIFEVAPSALERVDAFIRARSSP